MTSEELTSNGVDLTTHSDLVDNGTFTQILEMDEDDDDREFSKSIVFDFFEQAYATFKNMDEALKEEDFEALSSRGHFLKGSSATLGFTKVKDNCEKIQNLGAKKDDKGEPSTESDKELLDKLKEIVAITKREVSDVEDLMRKFFDQKED